MKDDLFLKKMKGVKPLNNSKNSIKNLNTLNKNKTIETNEKKVSTNQNKILTNKKNNSKFILSFGEINKDLKRGKVKIDRKIDLHGYTLEQAYKKFKSEVKNNYHKNKRCLLVITGKGIRKKYENKDASPPKLFYGKIKNSILDWINEDDLKELILTYQDAGSEQGGDGAIFVYLRKKKN